ncbi:unnamed protein product [Diamesa serratosioi]
MCQEMSQPDKNSGSANNNSFQTTIRNTQELRANLQNMSQLLNTGLTNETLDICIQLCEAGVHPQSLASIIQQIRRETTNVPPPTEQPE